MSAAPDVLIRELAARGIRLSRRGDKLHVAAPRSVVTDELRRVLTANKPRLMLALACTTPSVAQRAVVHFRISGDAPNAWATCLGAPGETVESVVNDLEARLGERLVECRPRSRCKDPR
jgi:hypothetical protein